MLQNVYLLFLAGIFGALMYLLDSMYRTDKRWALLGILCPPIIVIYLIKNWDRVKGPLVYIAVFFVAIIFIGLIGNENFATKTLVYLKQVFLWPLSAWKWIHPQLPK